MSNDPGPVQAEYVDRLIKSFSDRFSQEVPPELRTTLLINAQGLCRTSGLNARQCMTVLSIFSHFIDSMIGKMSYEDFLKQADGDSDGGQYLLAHHGETIHHWNDHIRASIIVPLLMGLSEEARTE